MRKWWLAVEAPSRYSDDAVLWLVMRGYIPASFVMKLKKRRERYKPYTESHVIHDICGWLWSDAMGSEVNNDAPHLCLIWGLFFSPHIPKGWPWRNFQFSFRWVTCEWVSCWRSDVNWSVSKSDKKTPLVFLFLCAACQQSWQEKERMCMLVTVIGRVSSKSRFIQLFSLCRE
jgi:hypothetical protein